ncbi:MAG TPA: substrate-binding domain-containing protein [Methylomirabilota bacterium]|nr:substrate-binding domain-containing protein [Methylomirabilota bacterium]
MLPNPMDARALPVDATASAHDREATPPVRVVAADALRLQGAHSLGVRVAPELAEAFLVKKRATAITRRAGDDAYGWLVSGQLPGDSRPRLIEIAAGGSAAMFQSLAAGAGDVGMASRRATPAEVAQIATAGLGDIASPAHEHVLGVDGMPVIVHPTNPVSSLGVEDVARIFSGQVTAWAMLGKGEGRITLYARNERSSSFDVFKALVLRELPLAPTAKRFVEAGALADAVTDDVHGIGFASMSSMRRAKVVAVGGTGVPAIPPTALSVSAEEYPLSRRLYLYTTSATSNPLATEFVEFALSPEGQKIIAAAGFVDLGVRVGGGRACDERCPPRYAALTERGRRLAPLFRFRPGTTEFDSRAQRDIDRVADFVRRDSPSTVALAGFSERVGLSVDRARKVAEELRARGIRVDAAEGFGGAVPLVSKDVSGAEERNERVEVWLASR